jgi:hypothetical protein
MSELHIQTWTMPAADLGPANPLPPLDINRELFQIKYSADIPKEIIENMSYGRVSNRLPYAIQDGYTRELNPRDFRVAVLENELLKATFLLDFGGRLWSLVHKPSGRELLEVNPVFQLANLGIRNAWFSGGVEWNVGTIGHSPFTCSPLFAGHLIRDDGTPVLRFYEWERFRRAPFQIDAYLPDSSAVLFLRVLLANPGEEEIPIYWWSNIAVPESSGTRVIVPADSAYCLGCKPNELIRIPVPCHNEVDYTYSQNVAHAADYFFHIPDDQYPWITALDREGKGLIQVSTNRMFGRKLWVWGNSSGGKNWQKFLSPPGNGYIEIQAGLSRTQLEHMPMQPGEKWSWLEAYGFIEADPDSVHSPDWEKAKKAVEDELINVISFPDLLTEYESGNRLSEAPLVEVLHRGSGWGALERHRREKFGENPFCDDRLIFDDDSLSQEQTPWIELLEKGSFPAMDHGKTPLGFIVSDVWRDLLERSVEVEDRDNWFAWYHLGVIRYFSGEIEGSHQAWIQSQELEWTPWATRNLAVLARRDGRFDDASELLVLACKKNSSLLPLAIECGNCLIEAGRTKEWLKMLAIFPDSIRSNGRIRLLEAQAALKEGDLEAVDRFFADRVVVPDLREGEDSLSDLWFAYHQPRAGFLVDASLDASTRAQIEERFPLPEELDFRMS